jgi:hypothetical protein
MGGVARRVKSRGRHHHHPLAREAHRRASISSQSSLTSGGGAVMVGAELGACVMHLSVECYAGHRGEETPRRLRFGDRVVEVREVVDRWLAPEHRYFKVTGDDDATYIVRHDVLYDRWELTMFERASRRAARRPV